MKFEEAYIYFAVKLGHEIHFNMLMDCQSCDFYAEGLCQADVECYFCNAQDRGHVKFGFFDSTFRQLDDFTEMMETKT